MLAADKKVHIPSEDSAVPAAIDEERKKVETYAGLMFEIISKMGFNVPNAEGADDIALGRYQPSLNYRSCLKDMNKLISRVVDDSPDTFDSIRCRLGELKVVETHLLPLLAAMSGAGFADEDDCLGLLQVLDHFIAKEDDEEQQKSPLMKDLKHFNRLYKKAYASRPVMDAFAHILARALSIQPKTEVIGKIVGMITGVLRALFVNEDPASNDLTLSLAYARNPQLVKAMYKSRVADIIFCMASSFDEALSDLPTSQLVAILGNVLAITARIFDVGHVDAIVKLCGSSSSSSEPAMFANAPVDLRTRKPIRHGRFSGSVSVQLSTGENMIITNTNLFTNGLPAQVDFNIRKNRKLDEKVKAFVHQPTQLSQDEAKLYLKLSNDFLESHFNKLFSSIGKSRSDNFENQYPYTPSLICLAGFFFKLAQDLSARGKDNGDRLSLIYGAVNKEFLLQCVQYTHSVLIESNYPRLYMCMQFCNQTFRLLHSFVHSDDEGRSSVAKNIQSELLHSRIVVYLVKRVISHTRALWSLFTEVCLHTAYEFLQLIQDFAARHEYWYVSGALLGEGIGDTDAAVFAKAAPESNFSLEAFAHISASAETVEFYAYALCDCLHKPAEFNSRLACLIASLHQSEADRLALHKPSFILQAAKVLGSPKPWMSANSDLCDACSMVARSYSRAISEDPYYLVYSFFN